MTEPTTTPYSDKCSILGELWISYRDEEQFEDFISYNDIGMPLAYMIAEGIVDSNNLAEQFILETWDLLLEALDIDDIGFESLEQMLDQVEDEE